ncbi:MspA family porin [Skermania sp. ID1734]|uniref:MspA family porin n=1 Tax=Skermania sp. ID1734 TaxID=2597516 RepID=UPI00117F07E0|nr:MspA family porin [Skermania sp. ID1734]TSE00343.1 MspA family porin [Skermania sp. ID1734]
MELRRWASRTTAAASTCGALIALVVGGGAAGADIAGASRSIATPDGQVTVNLSGITVTKVPPLTGDPVGTEGFVTAAAQGTVTGGHAITGGHLETGFQVACALDVSDGVNLGLGSSFGPSIGYGWDGGQSIWNGGPNFSIGGSVGPTIGITLKPGTIVEVVLGKKDVSGTVASASYDQAHLHADGCAGQVMVRPYAVYTASTATADHTVATYADPQPL